MAKQEQKKVMKNKPLAKTTRKKVIRNVPSGVAHVKATFNNTVVTITDPAGNVIGWSSAGKSNFSGSRKSSAFAATIAAQDAAKAAASYGLKEVEVNLKGPGAGRESAVRGLQSSGLVIQLLEIKHLCLTMVADQEREEEFNLTTN